MNSESTDYIAQTLGSYEWLSKNEDALKDLFPETWIHFANINTLQLMLKLKILGVDYKTEDQLGRILVILEKVRIVIRDGLFIRRNPNKIFPSKLTSK